MGAGADPRGPLARARPFARAEQALQQTAAEPRPAQRHDDADASGRKLPRGTSTQPRPEKGRRRSGWVSSSGDARPTDRPKVETGWLKSKHQHSVSGRPPARPSPASECDRVPARARGSFPARGARQPNPAMDEMRGVSALFFPATRRGETVRFRAFVPGWGARSQPAAARASSARAASVCLCVCGGCLAARGRTSSRCRRRVGSGPQRRGAACRRAPSQAAARSRSGGGGSAPSRPRRGGRRFASRAGAPQASPVVHGCRSLVCRCPIPCWLSAPLAKSSRARCSLQRSGLTRRVWFFPGWAVVCVCRERIVCGVCYRAVDPLDASRCSPSDPSQSDP